MNRKTRREQVSAVNSEVKKLQSKLEEYFEKMQFCNKVDAKNRAAILVKEIIGSEARSGGPEIIAYSRQMFDAAITEALKLRKVFGKFQDEMIDQRKPPLDLLYLKRLYAENISATTPELEEAKAWLAERFSMIAKLTVETAMTDLAIDGRNVCKDDLIRCFDSLMVILPEFKPLVSFEEVENRLGWFLEDERVMMDGLLFGLVERMLEQRRIGEEAMSGPALEIQELIMKRISGLMSLTLARPELRVPKLPNDLV